MKESTRKEFLNEMATKRKGEENINHQGSLMKIIEYNTQDNITVLFPEHNYITYNRRYDEFKDGRIKSLFDKTIHNIGFLGDGKYSTCENGKATKVNRTWREMIRRCYSEIEQKKRPRYKGCTVCKEWHNFQNFAEWYEENYYEVDGDFMCIDKDILVKGNKIYSPDTCVFVPNRINVLFIKSNKVRGKYPIGTCYIKRNEKFSAVCDKKHLGYYSTPEQAFNSYKEFKEDLIKQVADEYKDKVPDKLYQAMYNYIVEITD